MTASSATQKRYFECLVRAASLGSGRAKLRVACALIDGQGVARDVRTGKAMLVRMAQRGDEWAHYELAERYMQGIGLKKSMRHGLRWLRYGVRCGFHPSETSLGVHLFKKVGTPRAKREAVRLYRRAARGFYPHACDNLSQCYEEGTGVRRSDVMATRWLLGAVECNTFDEEPSTNAWVRLAERHLEGRGVARDRRKAIRLLRKASDEGSHEADRILKRLG